MIELRRTTCGGKLSAGAEKVFVGDTAAVLGRDFLLHCEHCGTQYAAGDRLELSMGVHIDVHQEVGRVESGGQIIRVEINLSDLSV